MGEGKSMCKKGRKAKKKIGGRPAHRGTEQDTYKRWVRPLKSLFLVFSPRSNAGKGRRGISSPLLFLFSSRDDLLTKRWWSVENTYFSLRLRSWLSCRGMGREKCDKVELKLDQGLISSHFSQSKWIIGRQNWPKIGALADFYPF